MAKQKTAAKKSTTTAKKKPSTAKKKPVSVKRTPSASSVKKTTAKKKPAASAQKKSSSVNKTAKTTKKVTTQKTASSSKTKELDNITNELQEFGDGIHETDIALLPPLQMKDIIHIIISTRDDFEALAKNHLSLLQRRRQIGAGVRNYGFIDQVSDFAVENPQFAQFFNIEDLKNCIRNIEQCRELAHQLQAFTQSVTNTMLIYATDASLMARDYYHTVRRQALRGDPNAIDLERTLRQFFRRSRPVVTEPSVKEIERDIHAILTHKKDGKVLVEGERPKLSGGAAKVVDNVRTGKSAFKETAEGNVKE